MTGEQLLPVEQADRVFAADIYRRFRYGATDCVNHAIRNGITAGERDGDPIVQEVARFRLVSTPTALPTLSDAQLAEEVVSAANIVSHDGYYELDIDRVTEVLARHRSPTALPGAEDVALPTDRYGETAHDRLTDLAENGVLKPQLRADLRAILALIPRASDDVAPSSINAGNIVYRGEEWVPLDAYREAMGGWKAANARASDEVPANPVGEGLVCRDVVARELWHVITGNRSRDFADAGEDWRAVCFEHADNLLAALKSAPTASSQEQGASGEVAK